MEKIVRRQARYIYLGRVTERVCASAEDMPSYASLFSDVLVVYENGTDRLSWLSSFTKDCNHLNTQLINPSSNTQGPRLQGVAVREPFTDRVLSGFDI